MVKSYNFYEREDYNGRHNVGQELRSHILLLHNNKRLAIFLLKHIHFNKCTDT